MYVSYRQMSRNLLALTRTVLISRNTILYSLVWSLLILSMQNIASRPQLFDLPPKQSFNLSFFQIQPKLLNTLARRHYYSVWPNYDILRLGAVTSRLSD